MVHSLRRGKSNFHGSEYKTEQEDELCDGLCVATTVALTRNAADVSGIPYVMEADAEEVERILGVDFKDCPEAHTLARGPSFGGHPAANHCRCHFGRLA
jgi:hypothetical protein